MAVERELITKLSFKADKTQLDSFEKSIASFKSNIARSALVLSAIKGFEFFNDIANAAIEVRNLSDYAGIAVSQFSAMRQGAQQLGVSFSNFDKITLKISDHIRDSRVFTGKLIDLWRAFPNQVKLPKFVNETEDFKNVLESVADVLENIGKKSDKLAAIREFFQVDQNEAGEILRFFTDYKEKFDALTLSNIASGKTLEDQIPGLEKYKVEVGKLSVAWDKFSVSFVNATAPTITKILEGLNSNFDPNSPNYLGNLKLVTDESLIGRLSKVKLSEIPENVSDFFQRIDPYVNHMQPAPEINTTNNFTFNVPPGTSQAQAENMLEMMKGAFDRLHDQYIRDIVNNTPQLEQ